MWVCGKLSDRGGCDATHCELLASLKALLAAAADFFARYNRAPHKTLSIIGSNAAKAL